MIWCVTNANGRCWLWRHIRMKLQAYVLVVCIITTYHFTPRSSVQSWNLLHYTEVLHTSNFCRHMKGKKTSVAIWCLVSVDIFIILHKYLTCSDVHAGCNWRGYYQGCTLLGKGCWTSCELCQPVTKYNMPRWLVWKWWGKWNTKIIHKQNMYWEFFLSVQQHVLLTGTTYFHITVILLTCSLCILTVGDSHYLGRYL